jgi:hypothetical protein
LDQNSSSKLSSFAGADQVRLEAAAFTIRRVSWLRQSCARSIVPMIRVPVRDCRCPSLAAHQGTWHDRQRLHADDEWTESRRQCRPQRKHGRKSRPAPRTSAVAGKASTSRHAVSCPGTRGLSRRAGCRRVERCEIDRLKLGQHGDDAARRASPLWDALLPALPVQSFTQVKLAATFLSPESL